VIEATIWVCPKCDDFRFRLWECDCVEVAVA